VALRVRLLGGLDVEGVEYARLGSRKARRLLARLALGRGRPVGADLLVEVVWPEPDRPGHPGDQLSVLVSRLRAVLGAARLPRVGTGYALHAEWLDVDALVGLVGEARRRLAAGTVAPARAAIDAALALDRGVLLPDEPPADWLDPERVAAARSAIAARLVCAEVALAGHDPWSAADAAWAVLAAEPYDEAALRLLMVALANSGRPAQAITAYAELAARLRGELGVDPAPQTTAGYLELLRAEPVTAPVTAGATGVRLPGRDEQLRLLDEAYAQAGTGTAVLVRVQGEAGIGKTRLLDAWTAGLPADGTLLRATGWELGGGLPLQVVLDAIAVRLRRLDHATVARLLGGPAALLAPLVGVPDLDADAVTPRALTLIGEPTGAGHSLLFTALDALLSRLAEHGQVTLVIDDGHWLDRTTLAWLRRVGQRLADLPLLVVVAHRPEEGPPPPATRTITLGPLDESAAAAIVGPSRSAELYARSGGHPLFLVELAHAAERRLADPTHVPDRDDGDLPASIRAAVAERCERAGAAAATIRRAAVLGPDVDLDLLAAVLDTPPARILDHLEEGVRRHLLVERGTGFQFRHQLIREALQAEVGAGRTAWLHRQAARSLGARGGQADPLDVAYHARLGGEPARTAQALADAGELAAARFDHAEALRLFDEALAAQDAPALRLRRARAALPAGRFAEAAQDAATALAAGAGAEAMEVAAIAAYCLRDFPTCRRLCDDGARLAEDRPLRTSLQALGGRVCHVDGDLAAAEQRLRTARDTAPPGMRALADLWYAPLCTDRGDPAGALELLRDPTLVQAARHPFVLPHRHLAAAQALGMLGRVADALGELSAVDEVATGQRTPRFAARADNCRAWILRNIGASGQADELNRAAYDRSFGAIGMTEPVADALLGLADGRLRAGELAAARELLDRARLETATPHPFAWRHLLRGTLLAGRCALAEGDRDAAAAAARQVLAEADRLDLPRYRTLARLLGAEAGGMSADDAQPDVVALDRFAPLEAWWLTAELAEVLDVPAWRELAATRRARLDR